MTIRVQVTNKDDGTNHVAWVGYEQKYPGNQWMPGMAAPVPINPGETFEGYVHDSQRIVIEESP